MYGIFRAAAIAGFFTIFLSAPAIAGDENWTVLQPDNRYYDENLPKAVTKTGRETAMVKLDPVTGKWIASLVLLGNDQDTAITNTLVSGDGVNVVYTLGQDNDQLYTNYVADTFSVFSFPLPEDFAQAAKSALYWSISSDLGVSVFRMSGSGSGVILQKLETMADDLN